jgi:putative ABC transport system permease protein
VKIIRRLWYLLRQREIERELAEEIEAHRQMSGETSGDPRAMGNVTRAREEARAVWIWPWLQSVWQDSAYAVRNLRRDRGFALLTLAALGSAIGIAITLFTVYNGVALRPWPVKDPGRVVKIFSSDPRHIIPGSGGGVGITEYRYFAEHTKAFTGLAAMRDERVHFGFEAFGKSSWAALVPGDYFRLLGVGMQLGRGFLAEEDRVESPEAVAVLGYTCWRDHFGSDLGIIGKQIRLEDLPFTVVGVAPESFTGTSEGGGRYDVYLTLPALLLLHPAESWARQVLTDPRDCCDSLLGRLSAGVSRTQAAAELEVLDGQFRAARAVLGRAGFVLAGSAMLDNPNGWPEVLATFVLMFTGTTLIMLLACANVGNLLIARASARQKEIQIRRAIGAGRARIVRQLMTESLLLALGASGIGLLLAYKLPLFVVTQFGDIPPVRLTPDGTVLAYAVALAAFTCICFGLAPALHATRANFSSRLPLRNVLLAAQVTLTVILLSGAGLMLRAVADLRNRDPGFAIDGVSMIEFELPSRSLGPAHMQAIYSRLSSELPRRVALTVLDPLSTAYRAADFRPSGTPETARSLVNRQDVSPGYFDVLRIPIVAGRDFQSGDETRKLVLVNETLAHRYWKGQDPIGKTVLSAGGIAREVVGVVKDAHAVNLDRVEPTIYLPLSGWTIPKVLVNSNDAGVVQSVAAVMHEMEPRARMQVTPLRENLDRQLRGPRLGAELAGALGLFALILATVGMSGVFAYVVQQRTKEIGIRMALGARPTQAVRLVLGTSSRAVFVGLFAGFAIALPASRLLRSFLYGASARDPVAYLSVAGILTIAGIAASYIPARRAARVDPATTLRHE